MTIYKGYRHSDGIGAQLVMKDDDMLDPRPSQKLYNHSPDGLNWGYEGAGPAQLALALLFDVSEDRDIAISLHQAFKREVVAAWGEEWEISSDIIKAWLEEKELEKRKSAPVWQKPTLSILRSAERLAEAARVPGSAEDPIWKAFFKKEIDMLLHRVKAFRSKLFGNGG